MRIIGGKDYYDSARAFGADEEVVFHRSNHKETDPIDLGDKFVFPSRFKLISRIKTVRHNWRHHAYADFVRKGITHNFALMNVIVAGTRYTGFTHSALNQGGERQVHYGWNPQEFRVLIDSLDVELDQNDWSYQREERVDVNTIEEAFQPKPVTDWQLNYLIDSKIIVAINEARLYSKAAEAWKVNTDGLKAISFAKVLDPYQAFQDISMYVSGVLPRPSKPIVELLGEDIMLAKHGMDGMSFKKYPSKTK